MFVLKPTRRLLWMTLECVQLKVWMTKQPIKWNTERVSLIHFLWESWWNSCLCGRSSDHFEKCQDFNTFTKQKVILCLCCRKSLKAAERQYKCYTTMSKWISWIYLVSNWYVHNKFKRKRKLLAILKDFNTNSKDFIYKVNLLIT